MAQITSSREERIAAQRQADSEDAYMAENFANQSLIRQQIVAAQRQADSENEEAQVERQERIGEEKDAKDQRRLTVLRILDLKRKHISEAEFELGEEERTKPTLLRYMPAFVLAIAKDGVFDIIFFIPGLNFIVTFLFGITMFITLYLTKTNRSLFEIRRIAIFLIGLIVGFIPFLAVFPEQTTVVFFIFLIDKAESNKHIARAIQVLENIRKD